jgi:hypothetical protein
VRAQWTAFPSVPLEFEGEKLHLAAAEHRTRRNGNAGEIAATPL